MGSVPSHSDIVLGDRLLSNCVGTNAINRRICSTQLSVLQHISKSTNQGMTNRRGKKVLQYWYFMGMRVFTKIYVMFKHCSDSDLR